MPRRRLSPGARAGLAAVLVVAVALVVWTVVAALLARSHLQQVKDDLLALGDHPPKDAQALDKRLARDQGKARAAKRLMHQPGPVAVAWLPLVGRSLVAERTVADASVSVLAAGRALAADAADLGGGGRIDLDQLAALRDDLQRAARDTGPDLHRLAALDTGLTPPQVGRQVRAAQDRLAGLDETFGRAAALAGAMHGLLGGDGPRTMLIALQNNAELRGTGGLISSYAIGRTRNGRVKIGSFEDVTQVSDPPAQARRVPAPADYVEHYGPFLANSTIWKNVNMAPDGPTSSSVLAKVAALSVKERPDAVVLLDVPAMAHVLDATGTKVRLPDGSRVTGDRLVEALLVKAYGSGTEDEFTQQRRKQALEHSAADAFRTVAEGKPTVGMLRAFGEAVSGRHLMLWSSVASEQAAFEAADAAGGVDPQGGDIAMVTTQNLGDSPLHGNKLDYYVRRSLAVNVVVGEDRAEVTQTLTMSNDSPPGLGSYVEGVRHPGTVDELLELAVAPGATIDSLTLDGTPHAAQLRREDGSQRLDMVMQLARGEQRTWRVRYTVPLQKAHYRLRLVPQPLARPASLVVVVQAGPGVRLDGVEGTRLHDGRYSRSGEWTAVDDVAVRLHEEGLWGRWRHRLSDFWNKKVTI